MQFTKFIEPMITNLSDSASPFRRELPRSHWFVSFCVRKTQAEPAKVLHMYYEAGRLSCSALSPCHAGGR
jgi:hypothetical protein